MNSEFEDQYYMPYIRSGLCDECWGSDVTVSNSSEMAKATKGWDNYLSQAEWSSFPVEFF
jgi:hypothetical protein